jgi:hypothetical protein
LTDAGAYTFSPSSNGTYDQAGNLWEFLEASFQQNHIVRGGSWSYGYTPIESTTRRDYVADYLDDDTGFRIATAISPYAIVPKTTGLVPHYALTGYEQISALYLGILNREADGPGYQGWLSQLGAQTPNASLAAWRAIADQIAGSSEAGKTMQLSHIQSRRRRRRSKPSFQASTNPCCLAIPIRPGLRVGPSSSRRRRKQVRLARSLSILPRPPIRWLPPSIIALSSRMLHWVFPTRIR